MTERDTDRSAVRIEPWGAEDFPVLEQTMGDPEMTKHLGGPESAEQLADRQLKYERLADSGTGRMFTIVDDATGEKVGSVGYWDKEWRGGEVYEIGWFVISGFQRRGIGRAATAQAIARAASERTHQFLHAFPSIHNLPSNAICRSLGFTLLGENTFEFPPGTFMQCNDWRLDLVTGPATP